MKNLLSRTKSGRRKGSLGLVLDSDAADEAAFTNGAAAAPEAPAETALVEMRTRSSLVSDDSEDALAPL